MQDFKKVIAVVMIVFSAISLAVSLFLVIQIWKNKPVVREKMIGALTETSDTLQTTADGLVVVNDLLSNASGGISALADTSVTLADNVNKTSITIDSFSELFTKDLPTTITNTQVAILSAQQSAAVIDGVLLGLSSVPLIGFEYDPEQSLSSSLGDVAATLDLLPGSIKDIGDDLNDASASLYNLQTDVQGISQTVLEISGSMDEAQEVVEQYQAQFSKLQTTIDTSIEQTPRWINLAAWSLTFVVLWLMVAQIGLLLQGIQLMASSSEAPSQ